MMNTIGILNSKLPLILSHILINIPFIIWFMISFFASLSKEIEESSSIDGATELQTFFRIVLPLMLPGITAVAILSFMTSWNEYLYGVIFVQSPANFTIPLSLATLNSEQELAQWTKAHDYLNAKVTWVMKLEAKADEDGFVVSGKSAKGYTMTAEVLKLDEAVEKALKAGKEVAVSGTLKEYEAQISRSDSIFNVDYVQLGVVLADAKIELASAARTAASKPAATQQAKTPTSKPAGKDN
jgi:hypothetical protein